MPSSSLPVTTNSLIILSQDDSAITGFLWERGGAGVSLVTVNCPLLHSIQNMTVSVSLAGLGRQTCSPIWNSSELHAWQRRLQWTLENAWQVLPASIKGRLQTIDTDCCYHCLMGSVSKKNSSTITRSYWCANKLLNQSWFRELLMTASWKLFQTELINTNYVM